MPTSWVDLKIEQFVCDAVILRLWLVSQLAQLKAILLPTILRKTRFAEFVTGRYLLKN